MYIYIYFRVATDIRFAGSMCLESLACSDVSSRGSPIPASGTKFPTLTYDLQSLDTVIQ